MSRWSYYARMTCFGVIVIGVIVAIVVFVLLVVAYEEF
jgi:hypothetical protein